MKGLNADVLGGRGEFAARSSFDDETVGRCSLAQVAAMIIRRFNTSIAKAGGGARTYAAVRLTKSELWCRGADSSQ